MNEQDKLWIEKCKADKGKYIIWVDNDCISVWDTEKDEHAHRFSEFGDYFVVGLLNYIGCDAKFV